MAFDTEVFQEFINKFSSWSFSSFGGGQYLLSNNFVSQEYLLNYNPDETEERKQPGPQIFFFDHAVEVLEFDGDNTLTIYINKYAYVCSGYEGIVKTFPI